MKMILSLLCLMSVNVFAAGIYSDSSVYVVCDIPESEYKDYLRNGYFEMDSLHTEGFIHCAKPNQLDYVMNKYFKSDSYILFVSSKSLLGKELKYEGKDQSNLYPHLYRRFFKKDSIVEIKVTKNSEGRFIVPSDLKE